jgi:hypothetical protein
VTTGKRGVASNLESEETMNKLSQWAGYLASIFSILTAFFLGVIFKKFDSTDWVRGAIYSCGFLAAFFGVICLATAICNFINRK